MSKSNEELAEIAYNAYCETTDWKSAISGAALPPFSDCPEAVKTGWIAAANAIKHCTRESASYFTPRPEDDADSDYKYVDLIAPCNMCTYRACDTHNPESPCSDCSEIT